MTPRAEQVCWECRHAKGDHTDGTGECQAGWGIDDGELVPCDCLEFQETE